MLEAPVQYSNKKSRGFSLIEVLIATVLVVIVMLALLEAVTLYIQSNMNNILRDEAVRVTQDALYDMRSRDFNTIATETRNVTKAIRSSPKAGQLGAITFQTVLTVTDIPAGAPDHKSIQAVTTWTFLNQTFTHQANAMVVKP